MFTIANIATLRGQVTADGVICLMALYIEDTMSEDALASLCERSLKHMRTVVFPKLHLHHYAETVSVFIKITSKAREIITQIGSAFATSLGLQAAAHSADAATPIDAQAPLPLSIAPVENFSTPLSLSDHDLIIDQKSDLDQIERNTAQTPRDIQAIAALLDRHNVYEPKRSKLLADRWVTVQRIEAALYRSQHNSKRKSANPVPLAISELLDPRYRHAIDATAAQLAAGQPTANSYPVERSEDGGGREGVDTAEDLARRQRDADISAAYRELQRLNRAIDQASIDDRPALIAQRRAVHQRWQSLINN